MSRSIASILILISALLIGIFTHISLNISIDYPAIDALTNTYKLISTLYPEDSLNQQPDSIIIYNEELSELREAVLGLRSNQIRIIEDLNFYKYLNLSLVVFVLAMFLVFKIKTKKKIIIDENLASAKLPKLKEKLRLSIVTNIVLLTLVVTSTLILWNKNQKLKWDIAELNGDIAELMVKLAQFEKDKN